MKKINIIYWICTALVCAMMLFSAVMSFKPDEKSLAFMLHLGFGPHIPPFLAVLKIFGVIALLVQRFPRLKEWAYAGFTFDLLGALYSFIAVGDPVALWAPVPVFLVLLFVSYIYWHKKWALMQKA